MPTSAHPGAKKALAEIWNDEDRRHALAAVTSFKAAYGAKFPKAVAKITDDLDVLLVFYDYPAEHWIHLRTTDEIVNPFPGRGLWWDPFSARPPLQPEPPGRSRGQGGAPRRTSAANTARSAQSRRGRGLVRRKTATSCRRTRSSTPLVEEVRPISRTNPSTCQKIKCSNRSDTLG